MEVINKYKKEGIQILHKTKEELASNIKKIKEEGWSDNLSLSYTIPVNESMMEEIKKEPSRRNYLSSEER